MLRFLFFYKPSIMNSKYINDIDYGFRLNGNPILFYKDRSLAADEETHQTEKALRQMSMEYYVLDRCVQCGICASFCPVSKIKSSESFSPRTFIQKTRLGLLDLEKEELWACTNCGHCEMVCPFEIPLLEVMAELRHLVVEQGAGHIPISIKSSISSIAAFGNPWKEEAAGRVKWLQGSGINQAADEHRDVCITTDNQQFCHSREGGNPDFSRTSWITACAGMTNKSSFSKLTHQEVIHIFLGCLAGYDRRARKTAEAAMRILQKAQIPFKILADEEVCCGDTVHRVGDFTTAQKVKEINEENILKNDIKKMYVLSPHCFNTFKNVFLSKKIEHIQIFPLLDLIDDLLKSGAIKLVGSIEKKATFHDPCFFSKHRDIIDQPREILAAIPGIEMVEMEHYGKKSLCCGGGGGGIWRDTKKGERLSEIRLDEALKVDATLVVTSCPYCLSMLEDGRQGDEKYQVLEIMDICELIEKGISNEDH